MGADESFDEKVEIQVRAIHARRARYPYFYKPLAAVSWLIGRALRLALAGLIAIGLLLLHDMGPPLADTPFAAWTLRHVAWLALFGSAFLIGISIMAFLVFAPAISSEEERVRRQAEETVRSWRNRSLVSPLPDSGRQGRLTDAGRSMGKFVARLTKRT